MRYHMIIVFLWGQ